MTLLLVKGERCMPIASSFDEQMKRIYMATRAKTQSDLANILGIRQSLVSDVLRRKKIPLDWLSSLMHSGQINPEWILTGKENCYFAGSADGNQDSSREAQERGNASAVASRLPLAVLIDELARRVAVAETAAPLSR